MEDYRVTFSGYLKEEVAKLLGQARAEGGRLTPTREALKTAWGDIQSGPEAVGELLYHTSSGWPVFHLARSPWSIHFILNQEQRVVLVTKVALLAR